MKGGKHLNWAKEASALAHFSRQWLFPQRLFTWSNAGEAQVEQFYEDLKDLLELTPKKDVLFIIGLFNHHLSHAQR